METCENKKECENSSVQIVYDLIVAERIELEKQKKQSYSDYEKACRGLNKLQKECKHENAIIKNGWQGGGIYYCKCTCPACGRDGSRYVPQYHMLKNNEWHNAFSNTKSIITLEKAIEIGKKIGEDFMDNSYWWGEV